MTPGMRRQRRAIWLAMALPWVLVAAAIWSTWGSAR